MEINNDVLNAGRTLQSTLVSLYRSHLVYASDVAKAGDTIQDACHNASRAAGWWNDLRTGEELIARPHIVGEKLMLIVSELAEAAEGVGGKADDKLPHRPMTDVELADAVIRVADLCGAMRLTLGQIMGDISGYELQFVNDMRYACNGHTQYEVLMRIVYHVAKAMEGHRKSRMDSVFMHRSAIGCELARAVFLCFAMADRFNYDLASAIAEKLAFNAIRPDHKKEARLAEGGKAY